MKLTNIIPLSPSPNAPKASTYDIETSNHIIKSISTRSHSPDISSTTTCLPPSLLLPTLCHPHIHLDKPYLLTSNYNHAAAYPPCYSPPPSASASPSSPVSNEAQTQTRIQAQLPDYASLAPQSGEFAEALQLTSKAKALYTSQDLYLRGKQLLATGYTQGVTSARCFVEVDHVTGYLAVEVGLRLKWEFESGNLVRVQICAFAQDPIFSTEHGSENRRLMEEVLEKYASSHGFEGAIDEVEGRGVEVLGTTPYVETTRDASVRNIEWAVKTAMKWDLHLDFHLDYNLDALRKPEELMVWEVLRVLIEEKWPKRKTVVLGHCSALTLLPHEGEYSLTSLARKIRDSGLPVYFVGLPTSDLYMMGRPDQGQERPLHRPRGTLNILSLVKDYGLKGCIGVNNVGNAFTPFGSGDPLELAGWCVGVYQGGGEGDAERLYHAISKGARDAVGLDLGEDNNGSCETRGLGDGEEGWTMESFEVKEDMHIGEFGLLLVRNEEYIGGKRVEEVGMRVPARRRVGVRDVVWDTPAVRLRSVAR